MRRLVFLLVPVLLCFGGCGAHGRLFRTTASSFVVQRNVRDYGAVGNGVHDDTAAFIAALTTGKATTQRPGPWSASQYYCQTTKPSIVYVPEGTYLITSTLPLTYYTQLVGLTADRFNNRPTILCRGSQFACLDAGTDEGTGNGWYGGANQENFYHQVRNVVVDVTQCDGCLALNWEVSQATNVVNTHFALCATCVGIRIVDGSGGYMGDLSFEGGHRALELGNQQFTVRNVTVIGSDTAVFLQWGWAWSFFDVRIRRVRVGFSVNNPLAALALIDCYVENATIAVELASATQTQLLVDNSIWDAGSVDTPVVVAGQAVPALASPFAFQGLLNGYTRVQGPFTPRERSLLLTQAAKTQPFPQRKYVGCTRPQYGAEDTLTAVLANGTDVSAALQSAIDAAVAVKKALFVPYGVYFISRTIFVPAGARLYGEVWTRLTATANLTRDAAGIAASDPVPMIQVGRRGDVGVVQMADFMLTQQGPIPHVVLLQWNLGRAANGDNETVSGLWDVHARVGGAAGTEIDNVNCPTTITKANSNGKCDGAHTLIHFSSGASAYVENMWGWVADHYIDHLPVPNSGTEFQLNVYNGRGMVVDGTQGPLWLYGTAMEHSTYFQYLFSQPNHTMGGVMQTETPYYQPEFALVPQDATDPPFGVFSGTAEQYDAYGLAVRLSVAETPSASAPPPLAIYGTGMYSFFKRWSTAACQTTPCQKLLITVFNAGGNATARGPVPQQPMLQLLNTHGSAAVAWVQGVEYTAEKTNNGFCETISFV